MGYNKCLRWWISLDLIITHCMLVSQYYKYPINMHNYYIFIRIKNVNKTFKSNILLWGVFHSEKKNGPWTLFLMTVGLLYPWIPYSWIQLTADWKKNSTKFQKAKLKFFLCWVLCWIHSIEVMCEPCIRHYT